MGLPASDISSVVTLNSPKGKRMGKWGKHTGQFQVRLCHRWSFGGRDATNVLTDA
jgi:hypothetical protein